MQEFSDQNIVIIGGSYGIGEQVVIQAINAGAKVHSLCRNKPSWVNNRITASTQLGGRSSCAE